MTEILFTFQSIGIDGHLPRNRKRYVRRKSQTVLANNRTRRRKQQQKRIVNGTKRNKRKEQRVRGTN